MDFLETTNISYITKAVSKSSELNSDLIEELKKAFKEEAIDAPFCNDGDYDLDDLKEDLPSGWTLEEDDVIKPGQALLSMVEINYQAERHIDFDAYQKVNLVATKLGNIYPLSVSVESEEDPFTSDFVTTETNKILLFKCVPKNLEEVQTDIYSPIDIDECSLEDFAESFETWKEWLDDLNNS